jgi:hypothetical protein
VPRPRPPKRLPTPKSKNARANRSRVVLLAVAAGAIAIFAGGPHKALAIVTATPAPSATTAPFATHLAPNATLLPPESSLFFVLDETINSKNSKAGSMVRAHLREPLVIDGVTVAAKNAPVQIEVVQTRGAQMGNVAGSVEIYFEPFTLANGKQLPLHTPTAHIDPHMSTGQYNTRALGDTAADIFIPYHYMYHILRKGQQVDLRPGTVIRARTAAAIAVNNGAISLATPAPFTYSVDKPHADFAPVPLATPRDNPLPAPKATASPSPSPSPSPATTPSPH